MCLKLRAYINRSENHVLLIFRFTRLCIYRILNVHHISRLPDRALHHQTHGKESNFQLRTLAFLARGLTMRDGLNTTQSLAPSAQ